MTKSVKDVIALSNCRNNFVTSHAAFTLAEILIALAIVGVIAVLTIPALIKNYNQKTWDTAKRVFENRLDVATRQMNTEEKLAGYSNTIDFVNELKKYIKITRICDNNNITKCFNKEVYWIAGEEPVDMSMVTDASGFGLDWETDTVAVQFANGVNAVLAYNPNATQEPFNNTFAATGESMAVLYDVSGNKKPNTYGKDINKINVEELAGVEECLIPELKSTMCITQILKPGVDFGPMSYSECTKARNNGEIDVDYCYSGNDYYAGAVMACGGKKGNLPSSSQLIDLAKYVYNTDNIKGGTSATNGLRLDATKASLFLTASPYSDRFYIWTNEEYSNTNSYVRSFEATSTYLRYVDSNNGGRHRTYMLPVCIDN